MINLQPKDRIEYDLDGIVNDHDILEPMSRIESMLYDIKYGNVVSLQPKTRVELFLAKISGADVEIPEPATRTEMYLAKKAGMDIEVPDPKTRIELWLAEWAEGSGSLVTIIGNIVSFLASKVVPIEELKVAIEPVQEGSGDPDPVNNIRPITGWTGCEVRHTGANLLGGDALKDAVVASMPSTYVDTTDKYVSFASNAAVVKAISYPLAGKFKENTQYTFIMTIYKTSGTGSNLLISYTDGTYGRIPVVSASGVKETKVFVTDAGKTVLSFSKNNQSGNTRIYYEESGIFEGVLTAEDFKAYQGTTYPILWETEAGTVYGGTLDVTTGVLTVDRYGEQIVASRVSYVGQWNGCSESKMSLTYVPNKPTTSAAVSLWLSNMFKIYPAGSSSVTEYSIMRENSSTSKRIWIYLPPEYNTTTLVREYFTNNEVFLVYVLKTPITYQLTPEQVSTLKGKNNIWADTGDVTVTAADIQEITPTSAQALNMLLGGMYTNNHTADDVSDDEALNIILGGSNA